MLATLRRAVLVACFAACPAAAQDWDRALWGPAGPAQGQLDLPLPCGGARSQGGVSWFDGIDFTRRMSLWLRAEAPDALPSEDGAPGFVRLPAEVEWEFAARGGARVDDADFRAPLPPMDGLVSDCA